ncbi:MAG TPA: hypothetical protein VJ276_01485 [Thermoanaerobaculia bacterium]|nr:hypothetical protein [Thermoanaerobaculia bacterium]
MSSGTASHAPPSLRGVEGKLPGDEAEQAARLLDRLMSETAPDRLLTAELTAIARGRRDAGGPPSWELRRIACLALETQFLRIRDRADLLLFLRGLGLADKRGVRVRARVLEEGHSTADVDGFAAELRRRIERFAWIHDALATRAEHAAGDFLHLAQHECLLSLGRYCFTPRQVVRRILPRVCITRGLPHMPPVNPFNLNEARAAMQRLPRYEREIAELLMREPVIYWVADATPSGIHSLIEYPVGTIALVVKPPGSDLEIEIKRAGTRGERTVDCRYRREGSEFALPSFHHYYGGSIGRLLRWELSEGSCLTHLHRMAYGTEAPTANMVGLSSVLEIPTPRGDVSVVSYFGSREGYGPGFDEMRDDMRRAVPRLGKMPMPMPEVDTGGYGLTGKWIALTSPEQAVIVDTSSFRIERLAAYLASDGDAAYFERGLGVTHSPDDARRFADALFIEVLGSYTPPSARERSWAEYLDAAFAANRERANEVFVDVMSQLGAYMGFFCAFRAASIGESFVPRNVGLRGVFRDGAWTVRVIFMDHDSVSMAGRDYAACNANYFLDSICSDLTHAVGGAMPSGFIPGSVGALKKIYRVDVETAREGMRALKRALRERYHAGLQALERPEIKQLFTARFLREHPEWDAAVRSMIAIWYDEARLETWEEETRSRLLESGYEPIRIDELIEGLLAHRLLLPWFAFLYRDVSS